MKIMVVSDTHGHIDEALKQYYKLNEIDSVIHLGDSYKDALRIEEAVDSKVIYVKGNIDGEFSENGYKVIPMENHRILLTHGHMEKVKAGLLQLYYKALSLSCDIVFFGHTHMPIIVKKDSVLFINPGSLTKPKGGSLPSFVLVIFKDDTVSTEIIYP